MTDSSVTGAGLLAAKRGMAIAAAQTAAVMNFALSMAWEERPHPRPDSSPSHSLRSGSVLSAECWVLSGAVGTQHSAPSTVILKAQPRLAMKRNVMGGVVVLLLTGHAAFAAVQYEYFQTSRSDLQDEKA